VNRFELHTFAKSIWNSQWAPVLIRFRHCISLSILTAIFPVNLGQLMFIEAKDDGSGGDNCGCGREKLQSNHHHQQTNTQFLQAGCPSCRPINSVKALKGKYHMPWTCLPKTHLGVFQLPPVVTFGEGLPCLSSAVWCQYPKVSALHIPFIYLFTYLPCLGPNVLVPVDADASFEVVNIVSIWEYDVLYLNWTHVKLRQSVIVIKILKLNEVKQL